MRVQMSQYWGGETYPYRAANVYYDKEKEVYEVDFISKGEVIEVRQMVTDGVAHSESYAEDAAENWCLGYGW